MILKRAETIEYNVLCYRRVETDYYSIVYLKKNFPFLTDRLSLSSDFMRILSRIVPATSIS